MIRFSTQDVRPAAARLALAPTLGLALALFASACGSLSPTSGGSASSASTAPDARASSTGAPDLDPDLDPDPASDPWDVAIASIADPDTSPAYAGLELAPQPGFVPLARDARTGLWEFQHETGVVFVLVPGGRYWKGAQRRDPSQPAFDPYESGESDESVPVRACVVEPFLVARNELTVAQWSRIAKVPATADESHPASSISWTECEAALAGVGLTLPTSVQWEYAARGGTSTPWWTGETPLSLEGAENLRDASARDVFVDGASDFEPWDDGYPAFAPVGSFEPNPFGLYDVHGNAFEWCRDAAQDGERIARGGGAFVGALQSRVSIEWSRPAGYRSGFLGVRPSCELVRPPGLGGTTRRR